MSKRRTFHVDWDSPSDATGTVKRRHTTPVTISKEFFVTSKNPEPSEGRRLSGSFSTKVSQIDIVDSSEGRRSNEKIQRAAIEDNGGSLKQQPPAQGARKKDPFYKPESLEKLRKELRVRRGKNEASDFKEPLSSPQEVTFAKRKSRDFVKKTPFSDDMKSPISETPSLKNSPVQNKSEEERLKTSLQEASLGTNFSKMAVRREFGLKLSKNQLEWKSKSKSSRKIKNFLKSPITPGEPSSRSEITKSVSGIPRPKIVRSVSKPRGLVNSSSESSGIGSPLSPLSPQKDSNVSEEREVDGGGIRSSESKSSGLGSPDSPDSPLSPDSQQYTAFYLIQQQLEKLHNCPCERRQAQVKITIVVLLI